MSDDEVAAPAVSVIKRRMQSQRMDEEEEERTTGHEKCVYTARDAACGHFGSLFFSADVALLTYVGAQVKVCGAFKYSTCGDAIVLRNATVAHELRLEIKERNLLLVVTAVNYRASLLYRNATPEHMCA